jgi:acyl dehydratase
MHTDEVYAKESEFGERIAHGMLVLAVGSALLLRGGGGSGGALPQRTLALYGIDKVRFLGPTRFGDTLQTEGELTRMNELDEGRGVITLDGTVRNQRAEDLVRFTMRAIVGRRPA